MKKESEDLRRNERKGSESTMKAMVLHELADLERVSEPLKLEEVPKPTIADDELLVRVSTCAVCHTELDEIEGRTPPPRLPVILGHQAVGSIDEVGEKVHGFSAGERVGVAWIFSACGVCRYCREGRENLCEKFTATGRDANGGYAEYMAVPAGFAHRIPGMFTDLEAAPLLCAGAIGYRSLTLAGIADGDNLGLMGFGASGHLVLKLVRHRYPHTTIFVFARGDSEKEFARSLGAAWAGNIDSVSPEHLHSIIDTTPAWAPVVASLKNLHPGGRLVINAIRKEDRDKSVLSSIDYPTHLWMEKEIKTVANVTRNDVREFLAIAAEISLKADVEEFSLKDANKALTDLKRRKIRGAKVLKIPPVH